MNEQACTHEWKTCPVHGAKGDKQLPSFRTMLTCVLGGQPTNDGGTWNESHSNEVVHRLIGGEPRGDVHREERT